MKEMEERVQGGKKGTHEKQLDVTARFGMVDGDFNASWVEGQSAWRSLASRSPAPLLPAQRKVFLIVTFYSSETKSIRTPGN